MKSGLCPWKMLIFGIVLSRSRSNRGNGRSASSSDGEARYYQVMFKKPRQEIFVGYDDRFKVGDYVKVEADRGEDLGKLVAIWSAAKFNEWLKSRNEGGSSSSRSVSKFHKRMLRLATQDELDLLAQKIEDEETALALCRDKATARTLRTYAKLRAQYLADAAPLQVRVLASR